MTLMGMLDPTQEERELIFKVHVQCGCIKDLLEANIITGNSGLRRMYPNVIVYEGHVQSTAVTPNVILSITAMLCIIWDKPLQVHICI